MKMGNQSKRPKALRYTCILSLALSLVACDGSPNTSLDGAADAGDAAQNTDGNIVDAGSDAEPDSNINDATIDGALDAGRSLAVLDPLLRAEGATDTLFGQQVADPYRIFETPDNALAEEWVSVQNARTNNAVAGWEIPGARERLNQLLRIGFAQYALTANGKTFAAIREESEYANLFVIENGNRRLLLDVAMQGENPSLDYVFPSPLGNYVIYGLSNNGNEESVMRIIRVSDATLLPDVIERGKWSEAQWLPDESGFVYSRYPNEGEPHFAESGPNAYYRSVYEHTLGQSPSTDRIIYAAQQPEEWPYGEVSEDGRYVMVNNWMTYTDTDAYLFDRTKHGMPDAMVPVIVGQPGMHLFTFGGDNAYLFSTQTAARGEVLRAPLSTMAQLNTYQVIIPESDAVLEGVNTTAAGVLVQTTENIEGKLRSYSPTGTLLRTHALPANSVISGVSFDRRNGDFAVIASNLKMVPTILKGSMNVEAMSTIWSATSPVDLSMFTLERGTATSLDGTPINLFIFHRNDVLPNQNARVLLSGYGGFGSSEYPAFQRNLLYWMERGGVYALANIRGGGEFGDDWHTDGRLANKHHVYEDMEAAVTWLQTQGWSTPARTAITGASNGGLLMGALITRNNVQVGAVIADVGLYDMIRYSLFPPADLWTSEYGDPTVEEEFGWLRSYSPYHNVGAARTFPNTLVISGLNDTRAHWMHSAKFSAAVQHVSGLESSPMYFYRGALGHGGSGTSSAIASDYATRFAFLEHAMP